jgi:deazaflavin-dependent oxidoreductase (nitroreductase family)
VSSRASRTAGRRRSSRSRRWPSSRTRISNRRPPAVAASRVMTPVLGRRTAWFNRHVTNRITRPLARWLPGFGVVEHIGRRSGRRYRTPVNVFRPGASYVIALTYGVESEWVQNVLAAEGCDLVTRVAPTQADNADDPSRREPPTRPAAGSADPSAPARGRLPSSRGRRVAPHAAAGQIAVSGPSRPCTGSASGSGTSPMLARTSSRSAGSPRRRSQRIPFG